MTLNGHVLPLGVNSARYRYDHVGSRIVINLLRKLEKLCVTRKVDEILTQARMMYTIFLRHLSEVTFFITRKLIELRFLSSYPNVGVHSRQWLASLAYLC